MAVHLLRSGLVALGRCSTSLLAAFALGTLIALVEEVLPRIIFHFRRVLFSGVIVLLIVVAYICSLRQMIVWKNFAKIWTLEHKSKLSDEKAMKDGITMRTIRAKCYVPLSLSIVLPSCGVPLV